MEILVGNASPSPAYGHGHHQVLRGEPLFIPALNDIRKAALAHAEEQLRGTYEEVRKVDHRLQQARGHGSGTNDVEALQRQRKGLLDRLAELVPRFGRAKLLLPASGIIESAFAANHAKISILPAK